MSQTNNSSSDDRLNEILAKYLQAVETGELPDEEKLLEQHPEFAGQLREFLADKRKIDEIAKPDADADASPVQPADSALAVPSIAPSQPTTSGAEAPTLAPGPPNSDAATEPATQVGEKVRYFGDYELLEEIARGGMGVVYRARQVNLNRIVALKMILAGQLASEDDVRRFYTEAEAAANLDHPGIVPIFEVGQHDGQHYFSMGFVEGESLADRLKDGPLPPREAAEYTRKVAEAVAFAHEQGVIHRDLKPANILLGRDDQPKVTDFGLAKKMEADSNLTGTGQILGTPSYMPPEQASGKVDEVAESADVYSLGAILYALVTGRPPFQADNPLDTLMQVLEREPVSPRQLNPKVPRDLETICLKCLEKDRRRRYASAQESADELIRFLNGEPIHARPISGAARAWRWCKRKPIVASLIGVVAASFVIGTIVSTHFSILATERAREAEESAEDARLARGKSQEQLWGSLVQQARAERFAGRRWASLQAIGKAASMKRTSALRQEAIQTLSSFGVRQIQSLPFGRVERLSFNADGTMLGAAGSYRLDRQRDPDDYSDSRIVVWEVPSGRGIGIALANTFGSDFTFSPTTSHVILPNGKGQAALWDPVTGAVRASFAGLPQGGFWLGGTFYANSGKFSPDGELVATTSDHDLRVWKIPQGTEVARHAMADPIAFLSNDELLLWHQNHLARWNTTTGEETPDLLKGKELLDVSSSGRVAAVLGQESVSTWDLVTGTEIAVLSDWSEQIRAARLSPDGRLLALQTTSDPDTVRIWDSKAQRFKGRIAGLLGGYSGASRQVAFNQDGTLLAAQAGNNVVKIWNVETGETLNTLRGNELLVWRGDGRLLATIGGGWFDLPDGGARGGTRTMVNVWEVAYPTPTYVDVPSWPVRILMFSPDGKRLATDRTLWDIVESSGQRTLRASSRKDRSAISAFCAGGEVWTFHQSKMKGTKTGIPEQPITLLQLMPQRRSVEFAVPGQVTVHAISPDSKLLAIGSKIQEFNTPGATDGRITHQSYGLEMRDLTTNKQMWRQTEPRIKTSFECITFSPDAKLIATGQANVGIELWRVTTGDKLHEYGIQGGSRRRATDPQCVIFSLDSSLVFAGEADLGQIIVGAVEDGRKLGSWKGHQGTVFSLAIHPNGDLLASGGADGRICLWEVPTGRELAHWEAHDASVTALAFSPDGATLVSGSADSTLKLWNLPFIRKGLAALGLDWQTFRK